MEKAEYVDRVVIRAKVCTGCTMLVDGVCCDADPCENLIAGFLEEPPADVVPAHRKKMLTAPRLPWTNCGRWTGSRCGLLNIRTGDTGNCPQMPKIMLQTESRVFTA